jgi:hypothetical protein
MPIPVRGMVARVFQIIGGWVLADDMRPGASKLSPCVVLGVGARAAATFDT